jgi:hypothetical protein
VQVDPIKPTLKAPGAERLKLKCDILLSTVAFKVNLRRYTSVLADAMTNLHSFIIIATNHVGDDVYRFETPVGRCSFTVSNPAMKAPEVSALGATIRRTTLKLCFQFQPAPLHLGQAAVGRLLPARRDRLRQLQDRR